MLLRFTKMHGLGNDFVVLDLITQSVRLDAPLIRFLADRHRGIGCDQVLVVEPPTDPDMDFLYRIYNQDGSEAQQCGNGARCVAKFIRDRRLSAKRRLRVQTLGGPISMSCGKGNVVTVSMGIPRLAPQEIPFAAARQATVYTLEACGQPVEISAVSMGNPHAVLVVDEVETAPVATLGPVLEQHPDFPERTNVGFMQVLDRGEVRLRVFERGAGETMACGSGACAAVVAGRIRGLLDERVRVHLPGGFLQIEWRGEGDPLMMTGPATTVFEGQIAL
ncbi:MAG: diaminopimelate epimerase [Gammaproteobacteria bacterium]|nr:diaminopimelate epimerase [Gammaproteobacteria bacterium]MBP6480238.1 diaminopimelate epimerase [Pseudomonadales bacterium]MBP7909329.1 diaminopimelate epimerase [Pseudomonadales bacterium]